MLIAKAVCPGCAASFIVDQKLWNVGTARLRCIECKQYFAPKNSPQSQSLEEAANAAVPIRMIEAD
jgi:predicted Zn finger-like uncharacterized protein